MLMFLCVFQELWQQWVFAVEWNMSRGAYSCTDRKWSCLISDSFPSLYWLLRISLTPFSVFHHEALCFGFKNSCQDGQIEQGHNGQSWMEDPVIFHLRGLFFFVKQLILHHKSHNTFGRNKPSQKWMHVTAVVLLNLFLWKIHHKV